YRAEYFANDSLSGSPAVVRCESKIDYRWGHSAPVSGIGADNFSVRWTGMHRFDAGTYRFFATVDDGIRFWLDGKLTLSEWRSQSSGFERQRDLTAGEHEIKMEYFEGGASATAMLDWELLRAAPGAPSPTNTPAATATRAATNTATPAPQATPTRTPTTPPAATPTEAPTSNSPGSDNSDCPTGQFRAEYFANTSLSGDPRMSRCESTINYQWGWAGPGPGLGVDDFSARWYGRHDFEAGTYTFRVFADDGVRLRLDGATILDEWQGQARGFTVERAVSAGPHNVEVEYYEGGGGARLEVSWTRSGGAAAPTATHTPTAPPAATATPVPPTSGACPQGQFRAEYFANTALSGSPKISRCEPGISFRWGTGGPGSGLSADNFSVRWKGQHDFEAGTYTFRVFVDDGVRLRVDGDLILDEWQSQARGFTVERSMSAGPHEIEVEYFEGGGGASAEVSWSRTGGATNPTPTHTPTSAPAATATRTPVPPTATSVPPTSTPAASACPVGQYRAEYFANDSFSGSPKLSRCESAPIAADWGFGSPGSSLPQDDFSVRYVGRFMFEQGDYTFTATVDDGVRVWLNGTLLIDNGANRPGVYTATRTFPPGVVGEQHEIKVEFVEKGGGAKVSFDWAGGSSAPPQATPTPTPTSTGSTPPPSCKTSVANINLPSGFCIYDFATGLTAVRFMDYGPDGVLYATLPSQGRIVRLPDANNDGVADGVYTFASGLNKPHGLVFHNGYLYVAETNSLTRVRDTNGDGVSDQTQRLASLPGDSVHWSRTVIVGSDGKLYVSIGSSCDACVETDSRRATVMQFNADGTGGRVYSEGLRNAVGLAVHPSTGQIWASGNERDGLGDNFPGEILSRLIDGADFGWPRCSNGTTPDTRFSGGCGGVTPPVMTFQAHSAPLGVDFYGGTAFPSTYRGNLFIAFHGSWNRSVPTGYKIVRVPFSNGQPTGQVFDFATGWLRSDNSVAGRPVDVVTAPDGSLMVSDDRANRIYRIVYGTP
ncbi:MAG: PA14 domain-containing protein, partial [Chloroflexota bacterium]